MYVTKNHDKPNKNKKKKNTPKDNLSEFYPNYENTIHKKRG